MKAVLLSAVVILVAVAINTQGLIRSLAELSAFLCVVGLVINVKRKKSDKVTLSKVKIEAEEL
ncbi:hypothetical protein [Vibrio genomosp. F10]|uniref:hypothetical protein n=1 Tax=Vibrio genomosp. F10 TaxID=723171 RepID=UPI0002DDC00B|nr:hypothetical protein [Vibrio genomosp. F10]OEF04006.1 hypothetical protein A1QI_12675 [Vibrio genomosp. F10 str. 9ZB36]